MIQPPTTLHPQALADWIEASVLFDAPEPEGTHSFAEIKKVLEEAEVPDVEAQLTNVLLTNQTRRIAIKQAYPIATYDFGFQRQGEWTAFVPYSFLLLLSLRHHYRVLARNQRETLRGAELFEFLSLFALERYLNARVVRIGFPRRRPVPANFSRSVEYLCAQCQELFGGGVLVAGDEQDDKLDLVGWLPFPDARPGQVIVLAQCGIGTDWETKLTHLSLNTWNRHVRWHAFPPTRAFFVPFHHEDGIPWGRSSAEGGVIFDRLRVAWLSGHANLPQDFLDIMKGWCDGQVDRLLQLRI